METFKAQTPIEEFAVGVTRRNGILGNGKPATEMTFESGAFSQLRKQPQTITTRIVTGEFEFTVGADTHLLVSGESLNIPIGTISGCFCLSSGVLVETPL
ncbi:cupin [Hafnia paralvei]|uniref:cupin n=1 Tax=Hafnia paralvei TaxID=546367 RepID=UPI00300CB896